MRFKLEKMNTYPKNRAINSIFVMLMSQAYNGTVKIDIVIYVLACLLPSELYVFSVYFNTYYKNKKRLCLFFCFVAYINSHISSRFSFSKSSMTLLPTTTPSHIVTISSTCSFVEMPNPATTGKLTCDFTFLSNYESPL